MENGGSKRLSDLPKCTVRCGFKLGCLILQPSTPAGWSCSRLQNSSTCGIIWMNSPSSRTLPCVHVCAYITRKNAERKVRGSEENHPICYSFAQAVPVSKYRDNIFWSKDQRTYGLIHGLTKGKYLKLGISGTIWDVWLQSFSEHLEIMEIFVKHFEMLAY